MSENNKKLIKSTGCKVFGSCLVTQWEDGNTSIDGPDGENVYYGDETPGLLSLITYQVKHETASNQ